MTTGTAGEVIGQPVADHRILRNSEIESALDDVFGELPEVGNDVELEKSAPKFEYSGGNNFFVISNEKLKLNDILSTENRKVARFAL